jgi:hypothetical protein
MRAARDDAMKYSASESCAAVARPKPALLSLVVVRYAALDKTFPALPRENRRIRNTVRWKGWCWNMAIGLGAMALVSAAGWAGIILLVSSMLNK